MMNHWNNRMPMLVVLRPLSTTAKVSHLLSVAHPGEPQIGTETHESGWPSIGGWIMERMLNVGNGRMDYGLWIIHYVLQ